MSSMTVSQLRAAIIERGHGARIFTGMERSELEALYHEAMTTPPPSAAASSYISAARARAESAAAGGGAASSSPSGGFAPAATANNNNNNMNPRTNKSREEMIAELQRDPAGRHSDYTTKRMAEIVTMYEDLILKLPRAEMIESGSFDFSEEEENNRNKQQQQQQRLQQQQQVDNRQSLEQQRAYQQRRFAHATLLQDSVSLVHRICQYDSKRTFGRVAELASVCSSFADALCNHPGLVWGHLVPNHACPRRDRAQLALLCAAERGIFWLVRQLVLSGIDVDYAGRGRRTAVNYAARNCFPEIVRALVEAGADASLRDSDGRSPLLCAFDAASMTAASSATVARLFSAAQEDRGGADEDEEQQQQQLQELKRKRRLETISTLLEDAALAIDVNDCARDGARRPIHFVCAGASSPSSSFSAAASDASEAILNQLIGRGADVNAVAMGYGTPLYMCARAGWASGARVLLAAGAFYYSPSASFGDNRSRTVLAYSPLHAAAEGGFVDIVDLIVEDFTARFLSAHNNNNNHNNDHEEDSSLPTSASTDDAASEVLRLFLDHPRITDGWTAIAAAAARNRVGVVERLLELGCASIGTVIVTTNKQASASPATTSVVSVQYNGMNAFHVAAANAHADVLRVLLRSSSFSLSAASTSADGAAATAGGGASAAVAMTEDEGQRGGDNGGGAAGGFVVNVLLATRTSNEAQSTALHLAVSSASGGLECVRLLLDAGLSANDRDAQGRTALHLLCMRAAASSTSATDDEQTLAMARLLLGVDDEENTTVNETDLHEQHQQEQLDHHPRRRSPADVNARDAAQRTALHFAVGGAHNLLLVDFLVTRCGAFCNLRDSAGATALDLARHLKHHDVARFLANQDKL